MTDGSGTAHATRIDLEPTPSERDTIGRFGPGNRFSRGRPQTSITRELRRCSDANAIARFLIDLVHDAKAPYRERLQAASMILDRLEGRPISRALHLSASAASILPPGFADLPAETKARVLDDVRRRALAGELALTDGGHDGDEE